MRKMNKKLIAISLASSSLICGTALAEGEVVNPAPTPITPISVNGGKVTFNGEVTAGACAVSGSDTDKIVTLDTVRANSFTAANQLGNAKKAFDISLVDCDTSIRKTVQISFNGQTIEGNPNLLENTAGAGSATNVGLQLFGPDGAALDIGAMSSTVTLADSTTIPLSVDYKSTAANVTAGKVQSIANFQLTYN
ncbi:fimbrial protein [Providencia huaxiensis]|uniref:fimbrial protein n=1 Tax=Providencia TaxID=586 RepID=UPI002349F298|nr:fimbrial protein [Providencia sp. PROV076]